MKGVILCGGLATRFLPISAPSFRCIFCISFRGLSRRRLKFWCIAAISTSKPLFSRKTLLWPNKTAPVHFFAQELFSAYSQVSHSLGQ